MTGPETPQDHEPEFDSIEERLAFAEIALAGTTSSELPDTAAEAPPPDDPLAAFPD